jgi:hypothetical protein
MEMEKNKSQTTFVVCLNCHAADTDRSRSETGGVLASNQETFLSPSLPCLFAVHVGLSKLTVNYNCQYYDLYSGVWGGVVVKTLRY